MNIVAVADAFIPQPVMAEALSLLEPSKLVVLQWSSEDVADLHRRVRRIERLGPTAESPLGEASAAFVRWDRTVDPDADSAAVYEGVAERVLDLQRGLIDWVEAGRLQEMWRAAGVAAIDGNHQR